MDMFHYIYGMFSFVLYLGIYIYIYIYIYINILYLRIAVYSVRICDVRLQFMHCGTHSRVLPRFTSYRSLPFSPVRAKASG